jgi:hypothetical protein
MGSLLKITGNGTATVDFEGGERINVSLTFQNLTTNPVLMTNGNVFFATYGGWSNQFTYLDSTNFLGGFIGLNTTLPGSSSQTTGFNQPTGEPVSHVIIQVHAVDSSGNQEDVLSVIPILISGISPQQLKVTKPVYLGIMEPLDVISLQDPWSVGVQEQKVLTVMGQLVNGTGRAQIIKNLRLTLQDSNSQWNKDDDLEFDRFFDPQGSNVFNPGFADGNSMPIARFLSRFEVPINFVKGLLRITGEGSVQNYNDSNFSDYKIGPMNFDVNLAPSETLQAPVEGFEPVAAPFSFGALQFVDSYWYWGNGPGEESFSIHSRPEARYSYDMAVHKRRPPSLGDFDPAYEAHQNLYARMVSSTPDQTVNSNFFCWGKKILCMHDGFVVYVKDTGVTTQSGLTDLSTIGMAINSVVVVRHRDGKKLLNRYSKYYHLAEGSATALGWAPTPTNPMIQINAGQILGEVDHAGYSSEPHLHIGYFMKDATGRLRALPMRFQNLQVHICSGQGGGISLWCNDTPMPFVPTGSSYYNPPAI